MYTSFISLAPIKKDKGDYVCVSLVFNIKVLIQTVG